MVKLLKCSCHIFLNHAIKKLLKKYFLKEKAWTALKKGALIWWIFFFTFSLLFLFSLCSIPEAGHPDCQQLSGATSCPCRRRWARMWNSPNWPLLRVSLSKFGMLIIYIQYDLLFSITVLHSYKCYVLFCPDCICIAIVN